MMKKFILLLILILSLSAAVACESEPNPDQELTSFAFDLVCKGTGLTKAIPYEPADEGINQVIVMSDSTIGAQYDEYSQRFNRDMPEEWFPQIVDGTFDYSDVEMVLCAHRTAVEPVDIECEFEDDHSINVHNSTYELTLRSSQTAEIIAQETVTSEGSCPTMFSFFDEGETEKDEFADLQDAQIQAFIEPYVVQKEK